MPTGRFQFSLYDRRFGAPPVASARGVTSKILHPGETRADHRDHATPGIPIIRAAPQTLDSLHHVAGHPDNPTPVRHGRRTNPVRHGRRTNQPDGACHPQAGLTPPAPLTHSRRSLALDFRTLIFSFRPPMSVVFPFLYL
jgi:hypothetical protein